MRLIKPGLSLSTFLEASPYGKGFLQLTPLASLVLVFFLNPSFHFVGPDAWPAMQNGLPPPFPKLRARHFSAALYGQSKLESGHLPTVLSGPPNLLRSVENTLHEPQYF